MDKELNKQIFTEKYSKMDNGYFDYYDEKFKSNGLKLLYNNFCWFVSDYDDVCTGKSKYFYSNAFNNSQEAYELYINNPEKYYYMKPYFDVCKYISDDIKVDKYREKQIKETLQYAIDYYFCGVDYVEP